MYVSEALGSIGIGLVGGWLASMLANGRALPLRNSIWISLAIVLIAVWIFFITNWQTMILFIGSVVLALSIRYWWLQQLRHSLANMSIREEDKNG